MKAIFVLLLALQITPSFAANLHAGVDDVCAKYGCTFPPIEAIFDPIHRGWLFPPTPN